MGLAPGVRWDRPAGRWRWQSRRRGFNSRGAYVATYYSTAGLWASGTAISPRSARCICRRWLHGHVGTAASAARTGSGSPDQPPGRARAPPARIRPGRRRRWCCAACARVHDGATLAHLTETLAPADVGPIPIPTKIMQASLLTLLRAFVQPTIGRQAVPLRSQPARWTGSRGNPAICKHMLLCGFKWASPQTCI